MNIADELGKLQDLHRSGALTDEEFAVAKAAVLAKGAAGTEPANEPALQEHLEEIKLQNEVARLDREWEMQREQYKIAGAHGHRFIPTRGMSVIGGILITVFGVFWTAVAASMFPSIEGLLGCFPAFGVLFVLFGVGMSIYSYSKASQYEQAHQEYQARRAKMLSGR